VKTLITFFSCLIGACIGAGTPQHPAADKLASMATESGIERGLADPFDSRSFSGNYLASQFAQRHHDWARAGAYVQNVMSYDPGDIQLMSKAMVLSMGSGDSTAAMDMAHKIIAVQPTASLPLLFLAIESFQKKSYSQAQIYIKTMPDGSLSDFILPLLESWSLAAEGTFSIEGLDKNTIHLYHAILIADYLGKKDTVEELLPKALSVQEISLPDLERLADIYMHIGKKNTALQLYERIAEEWPENRPLSQKIERINAGQDTDTFHTVQSPENGVAKALYEMARLLYQEYSDDSVRVFAHLALYLDPEFSDADLLLGYVTARNRRYDDAIAYYQSIRPGHKKYAEARRMAADMLEDADRTEEALAELQDLVNNEHDLEALIQIGDIYRRNEDFGQAVASYNRAEDLLGGTIPREYWQVHYVRGMSYERLGDWNKAEADLKAALAYQPEHPLILNYLGYAWADQGVNLKQSMEYIRKAAALQPDDGYITDSLGWILFRTGKFEEAVPHLEKAVELLPYDPVINDHLGDAYWRVGRKLEARFQWERAKNHATDEEMIADLDQKLDHGLQQADIVKEASSRASEADTRKP
jgi:tetratricopeptide (TPR) repeat protein